MLVSLFHQDECVSIKITSITEMRLCVKPAYSCTVFLSLVGNLNCAFWVIHKMLMNLIITDKHIHNILHKRVFIFVPPR